MTFEAKIEVIRNKNNIVLEIYRNLYGPRDKPFIIKFNNTVLFEAIMDIITPSRTVQSIKKIIALTYLKTYIYKYPGRSFIQLTIQGSDHKYHNIIINLPNDDVASIKEFMMEIHN